MPAIGKITLDIKDYEKALNRARQQGQKFAAGSQQDPSEIADNHHATIHSLFFFQQVQHRHSGSSARFTVITVSHNPTV